MEEVLFEGSLKETTEYQYVKNESTVNGLPNYYLNLREHISVASSDFCFETSMESDTKREVQFKNFTPGTVVALRWVAFTPYLGWRVVGDCVHLCVESSGTLQSLI